MTQGYYSLIQYCPDFSRAEAANVGVLLFQPEPALTAVRIVDDLHPALKRLGRKDDPTSLLSTVQSMRNRIGHEMFRSVEDLVNFVRTRGNQIQLTMPRSMRIDDFDESLDTMFDELVATPSAMLSSARPPDPSLLQKTFSSLAERMPERVFVRPEFRVSGMGLALRPDYAFRNGCLNIVQQMPKSRSVRGLQSSAFALSKESELVGRLEEGKGKLIVVSSLDRADAKDAEREHAFEAMLRELGDAEFVASEKIAQFAARVESELVGH